MRELKFRAWVDGEMKGPFVINSANCERYGSDENLMQFIGFKDKNGVEIYEGDIFEHVDLDDGFEDTTPAVIFWSNELSSFLWHPVNSDEGMSTLLPDGNQMKVIGNIYESRNQ